tara:strand:+ start:19956 stop:22232 length:2277 start_codon:yes stop_codon:yes gene_type:complete
MPSIFQERNTLFPDFIAVIKRPETASAECWPVSDAVYWVFQAVDGTLLLYVVDGKGLLTCRHQLQGHKQEVSDIFALPTGELISYPYIRSICVWSWKKNSGWTSSVIPIERSAENSFCVLSANSFVSWDSYNKTLNIYERSIHGAWYRETLIFSFSAPTAIGMLSTNEFVFYDYAAESMSTWLCDEFGIWSLSKQSIGKMLSICVLSANEFVSLSVKGETLIWQREPSTRDWQSFPLVTSRQQEYRDYEGSSIGADSAMTLTRAGAIPKVYALSCDEFICTEFSSVSIWQRSTQLREWRKTAEFTLRLKDDLRSPDVCVLSFNQIIFWLDNTQQVCKRVSTGWELTPPVTFGYEKVFNGFDSVRDARTFTRSRACGSIEALSSGQVVSVRKGIPSIWSRDTNGVLTPVTIAGFEGRTVLHVDSTCALPHNELLCVLGDSLSIYELNGTDKWTEKAYLRVKSCVRITHVCVLPTGEIITSLKDNMVCILGHDENGKWVVKAELSGHRDRVDSMSVLPTGEIVTGSYDATVCIWQRDEENKWNQTARLSVAGGTGNTYTNPVAYRPLLSGRGLVSSICLDGHAIGVTCVCTLPNGDIICGLEESQLYLCQRHENGQWHWDTLTSEHDSFSPIAGLCALSSLAFVSAGYNGSVDVWRREHLGARFTCVETIECATTIQSLSKFVIAEQGVVVICVTTVDGRIMTLKRYSMHPRALRQREIGGLHPRRKPSPRLNSLMRPMSYQLPLSIMPSMLEQFQAMHV